MPYNIRRGLSSRAQVSPLTSAEAEPCPCKVVEASSRHVTKTFKGIPIFLGGRQIAHLEPLARSAPHKRLRLASAGFKSSSEFAGGGSEDHRPGKLAYDVRN